MKIKEAIAKMREGYAVRREGWTDDLFPQAYPNSNEAIRDHLYLKIDADGAEDLRTCYGFGGKKRFHTDLTSEDAHATDWVIYHPGIGCKLCKCKK